MRGQSEPMTRYVCVRVCVREAMKSKCSKVVKVVAGALVAGWSWSGFAGGFRLPDQDAFATARGEAFVATADNPSAIYYNPAGLGLLQGNNFRGGVYGVYLDPSYESPNGRTFDNEAKWHAVPQFFYGYGSTNLPVSFGLGLYSPYGLGLKWPDDTGFRTVGTESCMTYGTVNPAMAWKILPGLSLGAGLTVNYANVDLRDGLAWPTGNKDQFRFAGEGWDVGYNLGVLWQPHEKVSLGASFRSPTNVKLQGHTSYYNNEALPTPLGTVPAFPGQRVGADATFHYPFNAIFGVSYRPTPKWNFEFDADYADWSSMDVVTIHQDHGLPGLVPQNVPVNFDWQPSWYYEWGATRYLENGWSVSAGYIFNENSVPDAHYTPLVSDVDRHYVSIGAGHKGQLFDVDFAYQFGYGPTHTVSGSAASPTGQKADGDYTYLSHAVLLTVGLHF